MIGHDQLLDAVACYVPTGTERDVAVRILDDDRGCAVVVTEHERVVREPLHALARRLSRTTADTTPAGVADAFARWISARPVTDAAAAARGIATLGWSAPHRPPAHGDSTATGIRSVRWRVVVPRPSGPAVEWVPLLTTSRGHVEAVRSRALSRAAELPATPVPAGDAVVWTCPLDATLSSAVLRQPTLVHRHFPRLPTGRLHVVTAPGRPVAVADLVAATRLSEESSDVHVLAALGAFDGVTWGGVTR